HLGPKLQIPPRSVSLISTITIGIFVPMYNRIHVLCLRRITKHEEGFVEAFNFIRQIEIYNQQFPENMRSIAASLFFCTIARANYLSSLVVSLVHGLMGRNGKPDCLTNDINQGRVDYFYYLLAGLGVINLVYFVLCARKYKYKSVEIQQGKPNLDLELNLVKH
ncbi:hypothetical protein Ancab_020645, partial [Ancistrocladus abbreviatus]